MVLDTGYVLSFKGNICVLRVDDMIQNMLTESHGSQFSIHPGVTKMYQDLRADLLRVGGVPRHPHTSTETQIYI